MSTQRETVATTNGTAAFHSIQASTPQPPAVSCAAVPAGLPRPSWKRGDNERKRARYRVLVLAGMDAKAAALARTSPGRFKAALRQLGIDPADHEDLTADRRRVRFKVRAAYQLPNYSAPVRIHRVVSRPTPQPFPELGVLGANMKAVLLAAGVVRSADGNVP